MLAPSEASGGERCTGAREDAPTPASPALPNPAVSPKDAAKGKDVVTRAVRELEDILPACGNNGCLVHVVVNALRWVAGDSCPAWTSTDRATLEPLARLCRAGKLAWRVYRAVAAAVPLAPVDTTVPADGPSDGTGGSSTPPCSDATPREAQAPVIIHEAPHGINGAAGCGAAASGRGNGSTVDGGSSAARQRAATESPAAVGEPVLAAEGRLERGTGRAQGTVTGVNLDALARNLLRLPPFVADLVMQFV